MKIPINLASGAVPPRPPHADRFGRRRGPAGSFAGLADYPGPMPTTRSWPMYARMSPSCARADCRRHQTAVRVRSRHPKTRERIRPGDQRSVEQSPEPEGESAGHASWPTSRRPCLPTVKVTNIQPYVTGRNQIVLSLQVGAEGEGPVLQFYEALEKSDLFGSISQAIFNPPTQAEPLYRYRFHGELCPETLTSQDSNGETRA